MQERQTMGPTSRVYKRDFLAPRAALKSHFSIVPVAAAPLAATTSSRAPAASRQSLPLLLLNSMATSLQLTPLRPQGEEWAVGEDGSQVDAGREEGDVKKRWGRKMRSQLPAGGQLKMRVTCGHREAEGRWG